MAAGPRSPADRAWARLVAAARELDAGALAAPAMVFAPHPDDEVLGCGGTILRKRAAGARVEVAFLTDGADSHGRFLSDEALVELREREARAAARALALEAEPSFLRFPDGRLAEDRGPATEAVLALLEATGPAQIFVPCLDEGIPDHVATHEVVIAALRRLGLGASVLAYPVWLWNRRPWTRPSRGLLARLAGPLRAAGELRRWGSRSLLRSPITDQLAGKRAALACHASQMRRQQGATAWPILADVSDGDWLAMFFRDHELFEVVR